MKTLQQGEDDNEIVGLMVLAFPVHAQEGQIKISDDERWRQLAVELGKLNSNLIAVQAMIKDMKDDNKMLKGKVESLEPALENLTRQVRSLEDRVIKLEQADEQKKIAIEKQQVEIDMLKAENERLRSELVALDLKIMKYFIAIQGRLGKIEDSQEKDYESLNGCLQAVVKNLESVKDPTLAKAGVYLVNVLLKMINKEAPIIALNDYPELGRVCE